MPAHIHLYDQGRQLILENFFVIMINDYTKIDYKTFGLVDNDNTNDVNNSLGVYSCSIICHIAWFFP